MISPSRLVLNTFGALLVTVVLMLISKREVVIQPLAAIAIEQPVVEDTVKPDLIPAMYDRHIDLGLLTQWEGNTSKPVVPSNMSGPTVSMGLDLGTAGSNFITMVASSCVSERKLRTMTSADGFRGPRAQAWISSNALKLSDTEKDCISRSLAYEVSKMLEESPKFETASIEIRTAAVSFSMATGHPQLLRKYCEVGDWRGMSKFIANYHNDWKGPEKSAFQRRRKMESDLICIALDHTKLQIDPD